MSAGSTGQPGAAELVAALAADPPRTAILTDIDGTLAPIVERPEQAGVPAEARSALARLSRRFALVGCVSGRRAAEARNLVGVEELAYAGNHGLELLLPGAAEAALDPALEGRRGLAREFVARGDPARLAAAGLRVEDKGPIQALHWRGAEDEEAGEELARELAREAGAEGLEPRWGRKVLEIRPAGAGGKDAAVEALLREAPIEVAAYAGDDRTDLDAFRRLRELREEGALREALCVGIASAEAPPELAEAADLLVDGPQGWLKILQNLAR